MLNTPAQAYNKRFLFSGTHIPQDTSGIIKQVEQDEPKMSQAALEDLLAPWVSNAPIVPVKPQDRGSYWTLIGDKSRMKKTDVNLLNNVPGLGIYHEKDYMLRESLLLVEMNPLMLLRAGIPSSLDLALQNGLKKSLKEFMVQAFSLGRSRTINFSCVVHNALKDQEMLVKPNNLLFHSFLAQVVPLINDTVRRDLLMGIFDGNGVNRADGLVAMPLNSLEKREVAYRYFNRFEPNNGQILIPQDRAISSFWSAVIVPDAQENNHVLITYHLVVNKPTIADLIVKQIEKEKNLLPLLQATKKQLDPVINGDDKRALNSFISLLKMFLAP